MEANDLLASHETKESSAYADVVDVRDNFICLYYMTGLEIFSITIEMR